MSDSNQRPPFCSDANCRCIANLGIKDFQNGGSVFCVGEIVNPSFVTFTAGTTLHENDTNLCIYTPLKGWLRFNMNLRDFDGLVWLMGIAARFKGKFSEWSGVIGRETVLLEEKVALPPRPEKGP